MQCPKCDSGEMVNVYNNELSVERCDNCHGLYFDHLTRQDLVQVAEHAHIDTGDEEMGAEYNEQVYVECPRCFSIMDQRGTEDPVHMRFEICLTCHSTFLDAGEFRTYISDAVRPHFEQLLPEEF